MKRILPVLSIILLCFYSAVSGEEPADSWMFWRGSDGTGIAGGNPPVKWSETENIKWKVEVPGLGHSTPVVSGDTIFVTTAVPVEKKVDPEKIEEKNNRLPGWMKKDAKPASKIHRYCVMAYSRRDGTLLWEKILREELPNESVHRDASWASASPVTDGTHVWAFFGSHGLYCLDMKGILVWEKDFGRMITKASFGEGSSPALCGDMIIINWDHEGDSFITALDKTTGKEIWKKERDEITSWSTPLVVSHKGKRQIVVAATGKSRGYDSETGDVIWECGGMTGNVIPTPVYGHGCVYLMSGFRGAALQCVDLDNAKSDITGTEVIRWTISKNTSYTPSGLLYGDIYYFLKVNSGIISAVEAKTGTVLYGPQKMEGMRTVYASPVGASGRIYISDRNGLTYVLQHGSKFMVLANNKLDDGFTASPVIVGNELILRGDEYMYLIAESEQAEKTE